MPQITTHSKCVADFDGTPFEQQFEPFPGDHAVIVAHDAETGLCCALARAEGQPAADHEREARFQLNRYVLQRASPAGDASDPRA